MENPARITNAYTFITDTLLVSSNSFTKVQM